MNKVNILYCFVLLNITPVLLCASQFITINSDSTYYHNGQLKERITEIDTIIKIENWYENGQIKSVDYTSNGIFINKSVMYCENGQIIYEFKISKSDSIFEYKVSDCDGNVTNLGSYVNFVGCFIGDYIEFYNNKQVKIKGQYNIATKCELSNIKEGSWFYYDEQGKVTKKETYSNGVIMKVE